MLYFSYTPAIQEHDAEENPLHCWSAAVLAPRPSPAARALRPRSSSRRWSSSGSTGWTRGSSRSGWAKGKLPNFQKLAGQGGFYRLQTSTSPESPTSWASFATGGNAGKHNIFDFLVRDVKTYVPDLGMVKREMPDFLLDYVPLGKPKVTTLRGGTSFWVTAGQAGVRSAILTVPVTFPPEDVPAGEMLSGLPLPDIRGTVGTFYYFATDLSRYEEGNTEMGGILKRLTFEGDVAQSELTGPANPIVQGQMAELRKKGATLNEADQAAHGRPRGEARRPRARSASAGTSRRAAPPSTCRARRCTWPRASGASGCRSSSA